MSLDAQLKAINHLCSLDISWHESENTGNKIKRIYTGGTSLEKVMHMWFGSVVQIITDFVGVLFIITQFDVIISVLMFVFMVTHLMLSFSLTRKAARASQAVNIQEEELHGLFFETINNIRSVKVMKMAGYLIQKFASEARNLYERIKIKLHHFSNRSTTLEGWAHGFQVALIAFIVYGIAHGKYEVGFLVLFYGYFARTNQSLGELSEVTRDFVVAKYGVLRLMEVLREPIRIDDETGKLSFPEGWNTIEFKNVSFSYGKIAVLKKISFQIKRGERIGLVGPSGAGKSTILKLLLKEYENYTGEILIDGIPLRTMSREDYFNHVAVVLQDTEVFNFPLRENIFMSNNVEAKNEKLLNNAMEVAHVKEFLKKMPQGVDTYIGEKGVRLSGGERQRVGIARAIFKQPQILLLDEATSHLDLESEERIQDSLHQFFQNVTAIVIAHRLTTIKEMDRILVLDKGHIIESGSFTNLHKKNGRFFELWEKQNL
jgi:ABC-type multidrug transport system fused ATPase/permease subunit